MQAERVAVGRRKLRHGGAQGGLDRGIGAARDLTLLATLLEPLGIDPSILGFLRGVAAARAANA